VKKPPPSPEFLAHDVRYAARLVEALTLLIAEHARERHLTRAAVVGSVSWVLGRMVGTWARDAGVDLEASLGFMVRQLRQTAVGEFARRPFTLQ
jgi:hypothetical protein